MKNLELFLALISVVVTTTGAQAKQENDRTQVKADCHFVTGEMYAVESTEQLTSAILSNSDRAEVKIVGNTAFVKPLTDKPFSLFLVSQSGTSVVRFIFGANGKEQERIIRLPRPEKESSSNKDKRRPTSTLYTLAISLARGQVPAGARVVRIEKRTIWKGDVTVDVAYKVEYGKYVTYVCQVANASGSRIYANSSGFDGEGLALVGFTRVSLDPQEKCWGFFVFIQKETKSDRK